MLNIGNQYTAKKPTSSQITSNQFIVQLIPQNRTKYYIIVEDYNQEFSKQMSGQSNPSDLRYSGINRNTRRIFWSREKRQQYKGKSYASICREHFWDEKSCRVFSSMYWTWIKNPKSSLSLTKDGIMRTPGVVLITRC